MFSLQWNKAIDERREGGSNSSLVFHKTFKSTLYILTCDVEATNWKEEDVKKMVCLKCFNK